MKPVEVVILIWVGVLFVLVGVIFASPLICTTQTTISSALLQGIPAGIIALIVAGVGSGIAYRQYRVARAKFNLDLFDKRMECFKVTWNVLSMGPYTVETMHELTDFYAVRAKAAFLFGSDITEYLDDIERKICKARGNSVMMKANQQSINIAPTPEARHALGQLTVGLFKEEQEIIRGLISDGDNCKAIFSRYMSFGEWR